MRFIGSSDFWRKKGASIFHGATVKKGAEIRINGVVHLKPIFPENEVLPIGWIAVDHPMQMFPPEKHSEIWKIQKALNFPELMYGIVNRDDANDVNENLCRIMSERLGEHKFDKPIN